MNASETSVCVVGLGYIGLPTASLLGTKGFRVRGVDVAAGVVEIINAGKIHIVEPDLDILVQAAVGSGALRAATEPAPADVFILAVPTPFLPDHSADLSYVEAATAAISPHLRPGNLVILESTSPVGTTDEVVAARLAADGHRVGHDVFVAHCPERVLPGRILRELIENDRIVGGVDRASTAKAAAFYRSFVRGEVLETSARVAEMTKLTENSFRDVNIAFANELSMLCELDGIDVWEVIALANRHPRVNILNPGPGVGGHCIAVDPWFVIARHPAQARLLHAARTVNDDKPAWVMAKIRAAAERFRRPRVACLGLAFKANVDDLRESPAMHIVRALRDEGVGELLVVEPHLRSHKEFALVGLDEALAAADIVVVLVDHDAFRRLRAVDLAAKVVIDTRGVIR